MNDLQGHQQTQFLINQKATSSSVAASISRLNNDLSAVLEHQAYARKNPDSNVDSSLLSAINIGVDQLLLQYSEVDAKRVDLIAVKNGTITVDELITKYNIDLVAYSNALI